MNKRRRYKAKRRRTIERLARRLKDLLLNSPYNAWERLDHDLGDFQQRRMTRSGRLQGLADTGCDTWDEYNCVN